MLNALTTSIIIAYLCLHTLFDNYPISLVLICLNYLLFNAACAAARRAIGTLNGEQDT